MSFKINKSNFAVFNNPVPSTSATATASSVVNNEVSAKLPTSLAASAIALSAEKMSVLANALVVPGISSELETTKNKDTSNFHNKLFKKGVNVLRPEILLTNEFNPIVTGRKTEENQNSISVQYGNNTFVEVTNTARLLELHQILKENAITASEALIKRYGKVPFSVSNVITKMREIMTAQPDDVYDSSKVKLRQNLIDLTFDNSDGIVRQQIDLLSNDVRVLITDFVINDFIAKELIKFTGKIFDFKESIESNMELSRLQSGGTFQFVSETIASAGPLIGSPALKSLLADKQAYIDLRKTTNFENMCDIIGDLRSLVMLQDTAHDIENSSYENLDPELIYNGKKNRLVTAYQLLSRISFAGCLSADQRQRSIRNADRMIGDNVQSALSATNLDNTEAAAELIAAMCYDQVAGATTFQKALRQIDNLLLDGSAFSTLEELFSKKLFDIHAARGQGAKFNVQFNLKNRSGSLIKHLFQMNSSPYESDKIYIPFETNNTIAEPLYADSNKTFPGEEIFFTSALKANDLSFDEFESFIIDFKREWEDFSMHLIRSMGLDFDETGKKSSDDLNTIDQLNPISYLNFYLSTLADDLEATYLHENVLRRKNTLPSLAMLLNNASSIDATVSSYKAVLFGTLSNYGAGAIGLWQNPEDDTWIIEGEGEDAELSEKGETLAGALYTEAEAQTEKSFRKLLEGIGVENYPVGTRDYALRGNYKTTLTNTDIGAGGLGTFTPGNNKFLGIAKDDHVTGEPDNNFKRYEYGKPTLFGSESDNLLTKILNLRETNDWLGPAVGIGIGLGIALFIVFFPPAASLVGSIFGSGGLASGSVVVAGGQYAGLTVGGALGRSAIAAGLASGAFTTTFTLTGAGAALVLLGGVGIGTAAGAAASAINSGTTSITDAAIQKTRPIGITLTKSGLFSYHTLINSPLVLNIQDREGLSMPSIREDQVTGGQIYFFDARNNAVGFREVEHPGAFGGIKGSTAIHRSFLLHYFAVNILSKTQRLRIYVNDEKALKISFKISRMRGLIKALRNENVNSTTRSELRAYEAASRMINQVKRKIILRQNRILGLISLVNRKIKRLEEQHKSLTSYINLPSSRSPLLQEKLVENNFFEETMPLLNPSYVDYLSKSYYQNFVLNQNFSTSTFPIYDKDLLSDLKIMYRVLTTENYGFLEREKFGRKNVYHIGIPLGLLDFLRRSSYKKFKDPSFLDSSLIKITIHKNNQLDSNLSYVPKQFVFDVSKHILPFTYDRNGKPLFANHIENATDDKSLEMIINDMETFIYNDPANFGLISNGVGIEGIVKNRKSSTVGNYDADFKKQVLKNHIFDYYLKLYTRLSCNIDLNESSFLLNSDNIFTGQLDNQIATDFKSQIYRKFLLDYPEVATNPIEKEYFSRSINMLNNSVLLSSNNRLKEMMTSNCFERIFSILVNEKDFIIDTNDDLRAVYGTSGPTFTYTGALQQSPLIPKASSSSTSGVGTFIKEAENDKTTSMSGFSIEIEVIKKW